MSEAAQRKEKQKWAIEKLKLDNARRLRGIYLIDPADAEFKETSFFLKKKKETRAESWKFRCQLQMPCKIRERAYKETCRVPDGPKTKYAHAS